MKQLVSIFVFAISASFTYAQASKLSEEIRNALINGARVKMTIKVVDEEGNPVTNAVAGAYFRKSFGKEWGKTIDKTTDKNGICIVEERTSDTVFTHATKDGYYRGRNEYFATKDYKLDGDKWLPWDVTNTVVVRSVKKKVPMYYRVKNLRVPQNAKSSELFFDFMLGDWVEPYGQGKVADLVATFRTTGQSGLTKRVMVEDVALTFIGEKNGFYIKNKIPNSELETEYEASSDNIYTNKMEVNKGYRLLSKDEYFVIRIRCKTDIDGNVISAYYGVCNEYFYIPWLDGDLSFRYFININENERSLEFDGDYSHSKQKRRR